MVIFALVTITLILSILVKFVLPVITAVLDTLIRVGCFVMLVAVIVVYFI